MISITEKVIKFKAIQAEMPIPILDLSQFVCCRKNLQNEKLIGRIETGKFAGYDCGNISIRLSNGNGRNGNNHFHVAITGSQTSSKKEFNLSDVAVIESYEPKIFAVRYSGAIPSSETPLHWTAYETNPHIGAIIHAHILEDNPLYEQMPDFFLHYQLPLTYRASKTLEIGEEIAALIKERGYGDIIGMLNHDGGFGLLAFGKNLEEAHLKLLNFYEQLKKL